ncbi:MAG: hydantoinase/oxoprolinase family protein [Deltaproteobacteria bacterium]|nr:hydantoinase/oxoprolinase family protein [Deltaproteobacteria bacterium]
MTDRTPQAETTFKIGIDVGGTFTDLFCWSGTGEVETFKVLSTPQDPSVGLVDGLRAVAAAHGLSVEALARRVKTIVHGTTVTTNAVLTRRGAKTGLLTTAGVRDALEMRRGIRERQYDNRYLNVEPLVERALRRPVPGRLDAQGQELEPLDLAALRAEARRLKGEGATAVAVCFMNAFANDTHERAAAEIVRQELPEAYLSVSTELLPTIRFFDRISTTVLNAYVGPVLRDYLRALTGKLAGIGFAGVLLIMQSSGGVALPQVTEARAAMTLLSGPAGGPPAALAYTAPHGLSSCLVADMGGTSFDVSLVQDGHVALRGEGEIDRLRIALPMLDIATIGAGGGSIGWVDGGGLLRMGPQSAGALPGPACYGRGGELPTSTDAQLVLGYLDPEYFAGGAMKLQRDKARRAIETHIARPMGLDVETAAAGMYRVISTNMAHGIRQITVRRGLDPREFPLVIGGGAGPLHACPIALELEIPTVVVPPTASILCATGMLLSDLGHDFVRSCVGPLAALPPARLEGVVQELVAEGRAELAKEGVSDERAEVQVALDLRYLRQYHEVTVPVAREAIARGDYAALARAFHAEHNRLYGYDLAGEGTPLELINVRVRALGRTEKPELPRREAGGPDPSRALKGRRRAFVFDADRFEELPVYDGHLLLAGARVAGPALIERTDTTIFVSARYAAELDERGSCLLRLRAAQGRVA